MCVCVCVIRQTVHYFYKTGVFSVRDVREKLASSLTFEDEEFQKKFAGSRVQLANN